ncbi:YdeI/OmpD-associated family protein [Flavobacterium sp. UBA4854]|uniref:YdeI/OmpD-associated family protein n=1 Tax=Flavobacterium sp. UBA4854 TaxID=1946548 RepID=UPI002579E83F|nr:DUF1801 domain-containing protein [Flavobacterium sp. UBA4854]
MTAYSENSKVDFYFEKAEKWKAELEQLRDIVLDCHLSEELKWGCPCYTFDGANIVLIHAFKEYFAFLFFKGALMKDPDKILIQQSKNVQAARQVRFTSFQDILAKKEILKKYIFEAAEIEKSGQKVELKKVSEFEIAEELQNKFDSDPNFKKAFYTLTPGRQRAYLLHFSQPKQSKTREARVEKSMSRILEGKGLND